MYYVFTFLDLYLIFAYLQKRTDNTKYKLENNEM